MSCWIHENRITALGDVTIYRSPCLWPLFVFKVFSCRTHQQPFLECNCKPVRMGLFEYFQSQVLPNKTDATTNHDIATKHAQKTASMGSPTRPTGEPGDVSSSTAICGSHSRCYTIVRWQRSCWAYGWLPWPQTGRGRRLAEYPWGHLLTN